MEEFDRNEYELERLSAKMSLATFTFDLHNPFESLADKEIKKLKKELDDLNEKYKNLYEKPNKGGKQEILDIEVSKYDYLIDMEYIKEEIWALIEMEIIYSFKSLELNTKKLIKGAFSGTKTKDFYKWDILINFLKIKNIKPENLKGFSEIIQLKDVNNALKHSEDFPEDLKNRIPEFKKKGNVSFYDLNDFYLRIKTFPEIYLDELAYAIQTELYEFDEQKINRIANNIARRMEKKDLDLLISVIKSKY